MRRLFLLGASLVLVISIVLLLNFTHPNPTHRRYSSASPFITGQANNAAIGLSGEQILATDLGLIRNDEASQRMCICNSDTMRLAPANECNVCMLNAPISGTHRRPDFISSNYIAESKNRQNLLYGMSDTLDEQLMDYATAARAARIPLWIYVRVNTTLSQEIVALARSTGGDVIPYFTVDGYVDPVDRAAQVGLGASSIVILLGLFWKPRHAQANVEHRPRPTQTAPIDTAEQFLQKTRDKYQAQIDREESRHDL